MVYLKKFLLSIAVFFLLLPWLVFLAEPFVFFAFTGAIHNRINHVRWTIYWSLHDPEPLVIKPRSGPFIDDRGLLEGLAPAEQSKLKNPKTYIFPDGRTFTFDAGLFEEDYFRSLEEHGARLLEEKAAP